jgi:uncharacterized protein with von Willebrand factor type A (vWA) domain
MGNTTTKSSNKIYTLPINENLSFLIEELSAEEVNELGSYGQMIVVFDGSGSMQQHYQTLRRIAQIAIEGGADAIFFATTAMLIVQETKNGEADLSDSALGSCINGMTDYKAALDIVAQMCSPSTVVLFMTDGQPNHGGDWISVVQRIHKVLDVKKGGHMQSLFLSENATEADKSIMRKLCTVGQSPAFVTSTTYVFFCFFFVFMIYM